MNRLLFEKIENQIKEELSPGKFRHTLGVAYTACALAYRHGEDAEKARLAGLLHDCAKCMPDSEKQEICRKNKLIEVTEFEMEHTALLHAKIGAYMVNQKFGITDKSISEAVKWHTTGKPDMTLLEKIIYVADYIEPNRYKAPRLPQIRALAFSDLDRCVYEIMKDTVAYLSRNPDKMDLMTKQAYKYYEEQVKGRDQ